MKRDDISEHLFHFIKGDTFDDASETLRKILKETRLLGGTGYIKEDYRCVCFSEAPVHHLGSTLTRPTVHGVRWRSFGVVVSKSWLFARGGRPVIYQPDEEFLSLPARCGGDIFPAAVPGPRTLDRHCTRLLGDAALMKMCDGHPGWHHAWRLRRHRSGDCSSSAPIQLFAEER